MSIGPDERRPGRVGLEVEAVPRQNLKPRDASQRFEGIAFSTSGNALAVATSDTNAVFLFRRRPDGTFEEEPHGSLCGAASGLDYPHDISFSAVGGFQHFAVAQRSGAISIYGMSPDGTCGREPLSRICGPQSGLDFSDGVAFVPPKGAWLAACNLRTDRISFYRRDRAVLSRFEVKPSFELAGDGLCRPDGLAFSDCGRWLAVANHGDHTVSVFSRRRFLRPGYGRAPAAVIRDPGLRHPHSVAFTPKTNHLIVTNAGANYFSIYALESDGEGWGQTPAVRRAVGPSEAFEEVNARNKMEGGPKGVAVHGNTLAICSPEQGILIYSLCEETE